MEKQRDRKENTLEPVIKEAEEGKCRLFLRDAAHFVPAPFICKVRSLTRKFIKTAAGRNRINVLCQRRHKRNYNYQLKESYADKPIKIVSDNAKYQHCKAVMDLAATLEIELLFLPPYSPNLNIIERLWKFTEKKILYGKYYETPNKFHEVIRDFFYDCRYEI